MEFLDLRKKPLTPEITELLTISMGAPKPSELWKAWNDYTTNLNFRITGLADDSGKIIGLIGLEITPNGVCTIRHLAVAVEHRGSGLARRLLDQSTAKFTNHVLRAEPPDRFAVGFFEKCGFTLLPPSIMPGITPKLICERRLI